MNRLDEMSADLKGLRVEIKEFRAETSARLDRVEERKIQA